MLGLAHAFGGELEAKKFRQFFLGFVFAVAVGINLEITAFALEKAFYQVPVFLLRFEIQGDGGGGSRIAPGAQIVNGTGAITFEESSANGPHQRALAGFVGAVDQVEPRLKVVQHKRLPELSKLLHL